MKNIFVSSSLYCALLWLAMLGNPSSAQTISDDKPNKIPVELNRLMEGDSVSLIGRATFSVLFWDIYESQLLTSSGKYPLSNDAEQLIFDIKYLRDITSDELIQRTVEQWQHLGVNDNTYEQYLADLKDMWPDITKGDRLSLLVRGNNSYFYFNQSYIGAIQSPEFGQLFIDIWLSEKTSQPKLRKQLIGGNSNE